MLSLYKGPILNMTQVFFFQEIFLLLNCPATIPGSFLFLHGSYFIGFLFFKVKHSLLSHGYPLQKNIGSD